MGSGREKCRDACKIDPCGKYMHYCPSCFVLFIDVNRAVLDELQRNEFPCGGNLQELKAVIVAASYQGFMDKSPNDPVVGILLRGPESHNKAA